MLPEDCPGFAHLAVVDEVSLYVLVGLHQSPGQSHARASLRVEGHNLRRIAVALKIYSQNSNQLEKLEAARSAYLWLPYWALLSLTKPYLALLCICLTN